MPQVNNDEIIRCVTRTVIDVIGRRTSEGYSVVIISNIIKKLRQKFDFLKYVEIKNTQYLESIDSVRVNSDINVVSQKDMGNVIIAIVEELTKMMGKEAGYFFIREIHEDLPYYYANLIDKLGVDLEYMQLRYITNKKEEDYDIENAEIIKYIFTLMYEILDGDLGRDFAYKTMADLVSRFSTEYTALKYVEINDTRSVNRDIVSVMSDINSERSDQVGNIIQKVIQEINTSLDDKSGAFFIEKLKERISATYNVKLVSMGVNLDIVLQQQGLVLKHVLKALIDVLSDASSQSYAILAIDGAIKKIDEKFGYLKLIKIDSSRYSDGIDAVSLPADINNVRPSDLGRAIQKLIETVAVSLGEEAGVDFIEKFRDHLGKTYILRIEEMGVNLHMIEMKKNLLW